METRKFAKYYLLNFCLLAIFKSYSDISDSKLAFIQIFPMCRMEICIKLGLKPNFLCNFATVFMNYNAYFCGYIEKNVYSGFLLACSP